MVRAKALIGPHLEDFHHDIRVVSNVDASKDFTVLSSSQLAGDLIIALVSAASYEIKNPDNCAPPRVSLPPLNDKRLVVPILSWLARIHIRVNARLAAAQFSSLSSHSHGACGKCKNED